MQKYIDRPLLLRGRKFDIRVYVAVQSFAPLRAAIHSRWATCVCNDRIQAALEATCPIDVRGTIATAQLSSAHALLRFYGRVAGKDFKLSSGDCTDFGSHFTVSWYNAEAVRPRNCRVMCPRCMLLKVVPLCYLSVVSSERLWLVVCPGSLPLRS